MGGESTPEATQLTYYAPSHTNTTTSPPGDGDATHIYHDSSTYEQITKVFTTSVDNFGRPRFASHRHTAAALAPARLGGAGFGTLSAALASARSRLHAFSRGRRWLRHVLGGGGFGMIGVSGSGTSWWRCGLAFGSLLVVLTRWLLGTNTTHHKPAQRRNNTPPLQHIVVLGFAPRGLATPGTPLTLARYLHALPPAHHLTHH